LETLASIARQTAHEDPVADEPFGPNHAPESRRRFGVIALPLSFENSNDDLSQQYAGASFLLPTGRSKSGHPPAAGQLYYQHLLVKQGHNLAFLEASTAAAVIRRTSAGTSRAAFLIVSFMEEAKATGSCDLLCFGQAAHAFTRSVPG
jgi:hypothetical protein